MNKTEKAPEFIPLAVVGLGGVFPKAKTLRQFWANIKNKVDAIQDVPASHWSKEDYFDADPKKQDKVYSYKGGFLDAYDFDPSEFGLSPNTLEATDPAQLFALVAAKMALADAGYSVDKDTWDRARVSCILGVTGALEIVIPLGARLSLPAWRRAILAAGVTPTQAEDALARMSDEFVPWQEASFPGLLGNVIAGRVANRFNLGGTNCVVDAACGSSLSAMHMAALELQTGRAKMVVTGGVDTFNDIFMYTCFTKTPALSPSGHAKPFDSKADGTTLGEGIGMVVLKRLDDAVKDGDKVHAILRGLGTSSDGRGKSIYAPSAGGQTRAIEEAYRLSGLSPDTVELVEAHGTGTAVGDGIEVEAITGVYRKSGRKDAWCALGSVKSMVGHTKAAAGAAAFIKAAMALRHKVLPPTIKVTEPLPILAGGETPFYLSLEKRPWMASKDHPRRAACSALGFGGTNFHAILEEGSPAKTETDWDAEHELFAVSDDCASKLAPLSAAKNWDEVRVACAASRASFDPFAQSRLVLALERGGDWKALAEKAKSLKSYPIDGIFYGTGKPGKLGVLFPGQGAQYVGMSRDLVCAFPAAFDALTNADAAFEGGKLSALMFPQPAWKMEQKESQEKFLRDTSIAQPALGAAALSAWSVLARFGVKPDAAAGHSYGELVALHLAGRYDAATLHSLSGLRGRLMKGDGSDKGSMLAVIASFDEVEKAVKEEKLDLVIANRNAPSQNVLSGATVEIEKAEKLLAARGHKVVRLPVAAAFHSPLVAGALKPFAAVLNSLPFSKPSLPVYANTTGEVYPDSSPKAREVLGNQLAKPVEFVKLIEAMRRDGITTFVECGAGNRLTGLVGQILKGQEHVAVAVDASNGKKNGMGDLARTLAQLAALGHAIELKDWQGGETGLSDCRPKPKMSVVLTGATYRSTPKKVFAAPQAPQAPSAIAAAPSSVDGGLLNQALSAAQSSIDALTKLQEQTAALHLQFLQGQDSAQRSVQALVEQQQALYARMSGGISTYVPLVERSLVRPDALGNGAVPVAPVAAITAAPADGILPVLIAVVSEKTGYPAETINPDMDLEADLGIDSIKRVEILSAVSEKLPGAPKVKPEHLGTLRTLKQIAAYLSEGMSSAPVSVPLPARELFPETSPAANTAQGDILPVLVSVVADKTGYPADTINPDMDLEADLGIDSIKRVEILSAVSEKLPGAPKVKPEHLGSLRTLKQIAAYLTEGMNTVITVMPGTSSAAPASASTEILPVLLAVVADKTGYPADTIDPSMDLEADLGIDSIKRVEILSAVAERLPQCPKVKPEHLGTLRTLKQIAAYLSEGAAVPNSVTTVRSGANSPEIVSARIPEEPCVITRLVPELVPVGPRDAFPLDRSLTIAVTKDSGLDTAIVRELLAKGYKAELVSVDDVKSLPAELGALILVAPVRPAAKGCPWTAESESYLKKSFLLVQAAGRSFDARGTRGLVMTISRLDGSLGLEGGNDQDPAFGGLSGLMKTAAREWRSVCRAIDVSPALSLDAAAKALLKEMSFDGPVEACLNEGGLRTVALVERAVVSSGREPLKPGDAVIVTGGARGVTAECALALAKAFKPRLVLVGRSPLPVDEPSGYAAALNESALRSLIAVSVKGLSPKEIGARAKDLMAAREIRSTLSRLSAAGAEARYRAVDARDAAAVKALIAETAKDFGPIRGIVHGAGVLADKPISEKTPTMLDAVLDTKLTGLRNVLDAVKPSELRVLAIFSSSTARFGRIGQSDYAIANEALNKAAQVLASRLPQCRVASLGWGPWDGGMVDANLKKLFASEGVGVIGLEAGGEHLVAELRGSGPAETLVLAALPGAKAALPVSFERDITLEGYPFLASHVLNGRAVLPLALSAEWLAHAALHANPGFVFTGFDDLRVAKGLVVRRGAATTVKAHAGPAEKRDGSFVVSAELRGEGGSLHVSAKVLLAPKRPSAPAASLKVSGPAYARSIDRAYGEVLFHGADMRFILAVPHCGPEGIVVESKTALPPASWARQPIRDRWLTDPAALDAAFQAMILWTESQMGAPSLPAYAARYRQYAESFPANGVRVVVKAVKRADGLAGADMEFVDERGALVARMEGFECAADASLAGAFRRNALAAADGAASL
jgi:acyl transferase domain-containing protein/acyl carrier protein/NAD(P)-dependent dehydrogenase (short-subunit alcohol dehydrogenase family)